MHSLNVIVSKTSTRTGEMIRKVIGGKYNHCSFFVNEDVNTVYGFSRKYRDLWFTGCFTEENPLYYDECEIYRISIIDEQYEALIARIEKMKEYVKMYDYVAAALISVNIPKESERHYICSTFVADLIEKFTDVNLSKTPHLYKPMDIYELMESAVRAGKAKYLNVTLPVYDEVHLEPSELLEDWTRSVEQLVQHASDKVNDFADHVMEQIG